MTRVKLFAAAGLTALLTVLTLNIGAQGLNGNDRTFLTFSNTVELPGATLPPGTYLFRLAESQSNRHIVEVLSQDEKEVHTTILAVPIERFEATGENIVTFRESSEGVTPAVQYWYYPGDRIGHEFVYPKDQAMKIAARTGQNVLSTEGEPGSSESRVSSIGPAGETAQGSPTATAENQTGTMEGPPAATETPEEAAAPESTTAQTEDVTPQSETPAPYASETATADQEAVGTSGQADELPRTASTLPLTGLIGLLSLGGALAIRRARR